MNAERMPPPGKKLLTRDICEFYQISPRTVDRWVESGDLPKPTTIGRIRRWDSEQLADLERARMSSSDAQ
jgi:predicted DNA-binding transcriptional regulator AlpA